MNTRLSNAGKPARMLVSLVIPALLLVSLFLVLAVFDASPARADDPKVGRWVMTTIVSDTGVSMLDGDNNSAYGPFLAGDLGVPNIGLLDLVAVPGSDIVLASSFGDSAVWFIDVSVPLSPTAAISVPIPMFAEDIAVTRDGTYALVTDGAFSDQVVSIDLVTRDVYTFGLGTRSAQAVDVAPDGTVILADYWAGEIHTLVMEESGALSYTNSYSYMIGDYLPWPINLAVAPDGHTIIVCDAFTNSLGIYQIIDTGMLTFTGIVTGLPAGSQSVAYNQAGDKAYVVSNDLATFVPPTAAARAAGSVADRSGVGDGYATFRSPAPADADQLSILNVVRPGEVSLDIAGAADLMSSTSAMLFGVDVLAVSGGKAYVGNPINFNASNLLSVVDLTDYNVTGVAVGEYPIGVVVIPARQIYLPMVMRDAP